MAVDVLVVPKSGERAPIRFQNVDDVTFVNDESHGQGPVGSLTALRRGRKRLILATPNVTAVSLEGK